ncbi:MAG: diguanylate cyclase [Campylobacterales bacterium]|nr:diguanylate cyclase [Campylobacterales bacterium]
MTFPYVIDLATREVIKIDENQKLEEAVQLMYWHSVRDIVVTKEGSSRYRMITANDLIRFKVERVSFDMPIKVLKLEMISSVPYDTSLSDALKELNNSCSCLCVTDKDEKLCGFVTYTDIISSIDPALLMKEQKIKDILWRNVLMRADAQSDTYDILRVMNSSHLDSVILYEQSKAVGIITTKDTIRLLNDGCDLNRPICDFMSSPVYSIDEDSSIHEALEFVQREHFKRVIVSNKKGEIIGQISQQELLAKVYSRWAENLKARDKQLEEVNRLLEARASKYEEMAQFDPLTHLPNRSSFETKMLDEFTRIERYSSGVFSLIFFDIDHFKSINDSYGHLVGDKVLKSISTQCKELLRSNDMIARWGGEEFVVILPLVDAAGAIQVAEKMRAFIAEYIFEQVGSISCSFGVSQYQKGDSPNSLLHRTDTAMYQAKSSGRNCVIAI